MAAQTKITIEDVQAEMKRVTWPSWNRFARTTGVVIVAVFPFAGYFFVVDAVLNVGIRSINSFTTCRRSKAMSMP